MILSLEDIEFSSEVTVTDSACCPVKTVTGETIISHRNETLSPSPHISRARVRGVRRGVLPGGQGGLAVHHYGVPGHLQVGHCAGGCDVRDFNSEYV